jgi:octaprenyl-diphosphate synthase
VLVAFNAGGTAERAFWRRTIEASEQTADDLAHAMDLMARHRAIAATLARAARSAAEAKANLSVFPDGPIKACLLGVADYTVSRGR